MPATTGAQDSKSTVNGDHRRLDYLDALRGLAILGVLSIHCAHLAGGVFPGIEYAVAGFYGVHLFFMVSAFTIFMTLDASSSPRGELVRNFFIRRFFRILPMFWVGVALYAIAPGREQYPQQFQITPVYYLLTALLLQGWHPLVLNSVVPGGWSIAVEGSFYLVAPLLFFWIRRWQEAVVFLLLSFPALLAADKAVLWLHAHHLLYAGVQPTIVSDFLNRWFFLQVPVFACGILTYRIFKSLPKAFLTRSNGKLLLVCAAVGLYSILANVAGINVRLIPSQTFLTLCFLLLILGLAIRPMALIVNSAMCLLGRISYSFYLLHFAVAFWLAAAWHRVCPRVFVHPLEAYAVLGCTTLLCTGTAAYLTYRFIEQPFIGLGRRLIKLLNSGELAPVRRSPERDTEASPAA